MAQNPTDKDLSTDDGPGFVSDLVVSLTRLKNQQEIVRKRLSALEDDAVDIRRHLDAIESTLKAIGVRESDLAVNAAKREGLLAGQRTATLTVVAVFVPLIVGFLAWFIPATLEAIRYSKVDEERHELKDHPPIMAPSQGPPIPPRFQPKTP